MRIMNIITLKLAPDSCTEEEEEEKVVAVEVATAAALLA